MHLDEPFPVRYLYWVGGVLHGDLGESLRMQQPVRALIAEKLPVTLELACLAIVIALVIGIPAGVVSAVQPRHRLGLRRQRRRAVGIVHAELLARHHADPAVLGHARLAAGIGLRQPVRGSGARTWRR